MLGACFLYQRQSFPLKFGLLQDLRARHRQAQTKLGQPVGTVWGEPRLGHPSVLVALLGRCQGADNRVFLESFPSVCSVLGQERSG